MRQIQPWITRQTAFRLAPEVKITVTGEYLVVEGSDDAVRCEARYLSVLDAFRQPCTIEAALARFPALSKSEWMSLSAQILELVGAGVLAGDVMPPASVSPDHGFAEPEPHIGMLADEKRTRLYVEAIRRTVKPGDVVVDLGTGTGVLAIAAAQAGARHVFAIERSAIADIAERMFEKNSVSDRVTLIRNTSTRVTLPEKADVMISELIGTEPLSERALEYTRDALDRLLVANPRLVPARIRVLARAIQVPDRVVDTHFVRESVADSWRQSYGIDFSVLAAAKRSSPCWFTVPTADAAGWSALSPGIELFNIDLLCPPKPPFEAVVTTEATADGRLDGLIVFWDLCLDSQARLTNDPVEAGENCAWGNAVWLSDDRPDVRRGQRLELTCSYQAPRAVARVRVV